ncbi:MAG: hypothetical protein R3C19_15100 [Planctomycetaceae bacterium]
MQVLQRLAICLLLLLTVCGCQLNRWWRKSEVVPADPALPMTLSRDELVEYINSQVVGMDSWRSTRTKMTVRMPGMPSQRLSGSIACQAPRYFHLVADNVIAHADLGSNSERCWVYVQPGESAVLTWQHEDTALLQQVPTGVPYIDPSWLMLVLGVTPLEPEDYFLSEEASRVLCLNANERSPEGRSLRRVIRVDTVKGVVKEHAVYDDHANLLVRAQLSDHRPFQGRVIPTAVTLDFPQMNSEISLTFEQIETNPTLPAAIWEVPSGKAMEVVDLGVNLRQHLQKNNIVIPPPKREPFLGGPSIRLEQPQFNGSGSPGHDLEAPDWDVDSPFGSVFRETGATDSEFDTTDSPAAAGRARPSW